MHLYDVGQDTFNLDAIIANSKYSPSNTPETLQQQEELLHIWQTRRNELHGRALFSSEEVESFKFKRVQKIVEFAFLNTDFYHELYKSAGYSPGAIRSWRDFEALPLILKEDLKNNFPSRIVAKGFDINLCHKIKTSGSNGSPLTMLLDWDRVKYDTIERIRMYELMIGRAIEPHEYRYNVDFTRWFITSFLGTHRCFTVNLNASVDSVIEHVKHIRPVVVAGMGNRIIEIAERFAEKSINPRDYGVQCFSTHSETTLKEDRMSVAKRIGVPILDEYSSEELGLIAYECNQYHYHIVEDVTHVELLSSGVSGANRLIGTELWNRPMPIIRYDQGDLAELDTNIMPCACGSQFRRLKTFQGRADQFLVSPTIGKILPMRVLAVLGASFTNQSSGVAMFKLVQTKKDLLELILVPVGPVVACQESIQLFTNRICSLFDYPMEIKVTFCSRIIEKSSHKKRTILNRIAAA